MTAKATKNDPKKVDTLMGGAILLASGLVVGAIAFMNIGPYRDLIHNALTEWGWVDWLFSVPVVGAWLDSSAVVLSVVIGAAIFAGIQLGEVWPLVTAMKTTKYEALGQQDAVFGVVGLCLLCPGCRGL
jgi:hypothetical protein